MEVDTYQQYSQEELGLDTDAWTDLSGYIDDIRKALRSEVGSGKAKDVEEPLPSITSQDKFDPGGWVGNYPGEVVVTPGKIDTQEFDRIIADVEHWSELIGATTFGSAFPLTQPLSVDVRSKLGTYSRALIEYTDILRTTRLPVTVTSSKHVGIAPAGRPDINRTMKEEARGSRQMVAERTKFTFNSILNHLLVRFHAVITEEMRALAEEYDYYEAAFDPQLRYHNEFLSSEIPSQLMEDALRLDVTAPETIEEATREATGEEAEVVNLWEAYLIDIGFELSFANTLSTAVKPISKTYELWCLGILLDQLSDLTGESPSARKRIEGKYKFGSSVVLYYDRSIGRHSNYLGPMFNVGTGQPDFALEVDGEIVWVGDAKFKTWPLDLSDYQRFLTYVIDLVKKDAPASILYIGTSDHRRTFPVEGHEISHLSVRPKESDIGMEGLRSTLLSVIN